MTDTFAHLGLPKDLVSALHKRDIKEPFPIQAAAIPDAMAGKDILGKAPTGSGKTLAFGLPVLAKVEPPDRNRPRGLILAPTRELAEQIKKDLDPLSKRHVVYAIYGGMGYGPQIKALRKGVDILVATPGRLEDLIEQRHVDLSRTNMVVIDEADRMADMGFLPAVRRILNQTDKRRQTLLFSATLDGDVAVVSRDYQNNPVRHEAESIAPETIDAEHFFWNVQGNDRASHTADVVKDAGRTIVFTRTRRGADKVARMLNQLNVESVVMHGGRSQSQRKRALQTFSSGRAEALVATDVAARGIHVDEVAAVVHFDVPQDHKDYLHRSGRTGRAGATGTVVSFVMNDQKRTVKRMQRQLDMDIPIGRPHIDGPANGKHQPRTAEERGSREDRYDTGMDRSDRNRHKGGNKARNGNRTETRNESRPKRSNSRNDDRQDTRSNRRTDSKRPERSESRNGDGRSDGITNGNGDRDNRSTEQTNGDVQSVYIANLPWNTTEVDLGDMFRKYGDVQQATLIVDKRSGRSKGFGFVDMAQPAAKAAINDLHGRDMEGRDLTVRFAQPRTYS